MTRNPPRLAALKQGSQSPEAQSNRRRDEAPTCGLVPGGLYILVALRRWWWPENISSGGEQADADLAKDASLTEAGDGKVKAEREGGRPEGRT
jgi:hypothetical protein